MTAAAWPEVALGEVCDRVTKHDPARSGSGFFTYIDLGSVDQHLKRIADPATVLRVEAPGRARQIVAAGDVLVSTVRPNLNAVAIVPPELDGATASTGFTVLRPTPGRLDGPYLFHWVRTSRFVDTMVREATGASYPAVTDRIVRSSTAPLPPIDEQRRLAAVLDQADALGAKRQKSLLILHLLTKSIYFDMFGDPALNPKGWPVASLESLVRPDDRINYGVVQPGDEFPGGVPLIRASDLVGGSVRSTNLKRIAPEIESKYGRSRLRGDELLVSCVGSIGSVALANESHRGFNIARAVARVPVADTMSREYLAAYMASSPVQQYFEAELRTVAQPTLNIKQLKELPVLVPRRDQQLAFERALDPIRRARVRSMSALVHLDGLFASLQQRAFRGDL